MSSSAQIPQEELRGRLWRAALYLVVVGVAFFAGYSASYLRYGDAIDLRKKVRQQQDRIVDLENDRETMGRFTKAEWKLQVCERDLKLCKYGPDPVARPRGSQLHAPRSNR